MICKISLYNLLDGRLNPDKIEAVQKGIQTKYPTITFCWYHYEQYKTVVIEGIDIKAFRDLIAEEIHQDCDEIIDGFSI